MLGCKKYFSGILRNERKRTESKSMLNPKTLLIMNNRNIVSNIHSFELANHVPRPEGEPLTFLIDADFALGAILNIPGKSKIYQQVWSLIESKPNEYKVFITDIGMNRIIDLVQKAIISEEDFQKFIALLPNIFNVIEIKNEDIQYARKLVLESGDFESSLELACAKSSNLSTILTDRISLYEFKDSLNSLYVDFPVVVEDPISLGLITEEVPLEEIILLNGGSEWSNWGESYDELNKRIKLIEDLLEYHYSQKDYWALKNLWIHLVRFADLYGHSDFRLKWSNRISILAEQVDDMEYYFKSLLHMAWTHIILANLSQSKKELDIAHNLIHKIHNDENKFNFYHISFVYETHSHDAVSGEHEKNLHIINARKALDEQIKINRRIITICPREKERLIVNEFRNYARFLFMIGDLAKSLETYTIVLEKSKTIGWDRGVCYAHNKIADIYIEFALNSQANENKMMENIKIANKHIRLGKKIAEINNNSRRITGYCLSEAKIAIICGRDGEFEEGCDNAQKHSFPYQKDKINEVRDMATI